MQANLKSSDIHAIGITNQRETTVVWDRETGMPSNAVFWQCRCTVSIGKKMKSAGWIGKIAEKIGLVSDVY